MSGIYPRGPNRVADRSRARAASTSRSRGWAVVTSELGYVPKQIPELTDAQKAEVGEFLQTLDDHEDVHRVWAAIK